MVEGKCGKKRIFKLNYKFKIRAQIPTSFSHPSNGETKEINEIVSCHLNMTEIMLKRGYQSINQSINQYLVSM